MNFIVVEIGWVGLTTLLVLIGSFSYDRKKQVLDETLYVRLLKEYKKCGNFIKYIMIYLFISIVFILSCEIYFDTKSKSTIDNMQSVLETEQDSGALEEELMKLQLNDVKITDTSVKVTFKESLFNLYKNYSIILNK